MDLWLHLRLKEFECVLADNMTSRLLLKKLKNLKLVAVSLRPDFKGNVSTYESEHTVQATTMLGLGSKFAASQTHMKEGRTVLHIQGSIPVADPATNPNSAAQEFY